MQKSKGLGRGLDVFFGEDLDDNEKEDIIDTKSDKGKNDKKNKKNSPKIDENMVIELNISEVEPTLNQPRKKFDKEKLEELAQSIREQGVIQPIIVVKDDIGYTIVAGERRWRAAKMAGLKTIPSIVKDYTGSKRKKIALIENIQREDLNIIEIAVAIKELIDMENYTINEVAKQTGKGASTISNIMRLLKLNKEIQQYVLEGKLVEGQARALLAVEDEDKQLEIAKKAIEKKLTVREVENLIYDDDEYRKKRNVNQTKNFFVTNLEDKLKNYFGYKVKLDTVRKNQRIIIEYNDKEGLDSILQKLNIDL